MTHNFLLLLLVSRNSSRGQAGGKKTFAGERRNQDQVCLVYMLEYRGSVLLRGPDIHGWLWSVEYFMVGNDSSDDQAKKNYCARTIYY